VIALKMGGVIMKTITVRGLDSSLVEKLKQVAKKEGKSVNQIVLDTIKQHMGMKKEKQFTVVHHDMDHIFGRWSKEEFDRIQGKIDAERKIDKELW
jgi:predicted transcriptional regulator